MEYILGQGYMYVILWKTLHFHQLVERLSFNGRGHTERATTCVLVLVNVGMAANVGG